MGQSYDRRINLYINVDGKQVANDVKSIRGELQKVINEQNRMTIGSEEYNKQTAKIKQLSGILAQHRAGLKEVESPMQKLIGTAKGLLPAFGFTALAAGAKYAFGQIVNSTDTLSTKWAIFTGGLKSGLNEFWRTMATGGDWSNFMFNLKEAVRVGREYEEILDKVEEKTRALKIAEAESRGEELKLEEMLRNKTLSRAERIKAGQDRIKLEETLSQQRVKVAEDAFNAELNVTMQQTRLSKERLMEVVSDLDSETKAKAQAYNEQLEIFESAQKTNEKAKAGLARAGVTNNPFEAEMAKSKAILDSYPDSVKQYAAALRGVGSTTDLQLNKMVSAYEGLMAAQNSAAENTKRVRTQVNSLLAGKEDEPSGSSGGTQKDNTKEEAATKAIEIAYKQQIVYLKEKYEGEETLQKEYQARMLANELSYLMSKQELFKSDSEQYLDLQSQIITKQNDYNVAIRAMGMELLSTDSGLEKFNARLLEQAKLLDFAAQKHNEGATESENLKLKTEQQRDVILQTTEALSDSIYMLASGGEDAMKEAGKNMILFALDMLKMQTQIAIAGATVQSLMQPDSILTFGASGLIRAAILVGLIEAAFAGVKGLVNSAFSSKSKKSTGFSLGGFTGDGGTLEPAGIVHRGEWVAPNWMLENPFTADIIRGLEDWRRNPVTLTPGAFQATNSFGHFSKGGYTGLSEEAAGLMGSSNFFSILAGKNSVADEKQNEMIFKLATAIENLMKWKPTVYSEMIKKDLDTLDEINRNSGL